MYDEKIAELYDTVVEAGYHNQKAYINELLKILPKNCSVLEIGCGTGLTLIPLLKSGINCEGVDNSEPMLKKLKEKEKEAAVYFSDVRTFAPKKNYDYILSCNGPFSIKNNELESYILEKEDIEKVIIKYSKLSKNGLLINKGKEKDSLVIEIKNDGQLIHRETSQGDYRIMMNMLFEGENFIAKQDFIKRRYPLKELLKGAKVKNFERFILVKF